MLPSTAGAEKQVSRRVGLVTIVVAIAAFSAPTIYLLRAPTAHAVPPAKEQAKPLKAPQAAALTLGPPPDAVGDAPNKAPTTRQVPATIRAGKQREFLPAPTEREEKILKALAEPADADFVEFPLQEVIDFFRDKYSIEIELDIRALTDAAIERDTPITLQAKDVPLRSILRRMLSRLELTFFVDDDTLIITANEVADNAIVTRTYPVGDLISTKLVGTLDPQTAKMDEKASTAGEAAKVATGRTSRPISRPPAEYARLVSAITESILPDSWSVNSGLGAIVAVPESRSLVISQTHAAQEDVVRLLRALREAQAMNDQSAKEIPPVMAH